MREFLKIHGDKLVLIIPLCWLSIKWLIDGHIIAFFLTVIFAIVFISWADE